MTEYDCNPPADVSSKLIAVVERLTTARFASTFAPETAARLVADSYDQLAAEAKVDTYLPVMTQHFAADRPPVCDRRR
jgi:hypothetical protein